MANQKQSYSDSYSEVKNRSYGNWPSFAIPESHVLKDGSQNLRKTTLQRQVFTKCSQVALRLQLLRTSLPLFVEG